MINKDILIVDDEPKNLELLSILLKKNGHNTVAASGGLEALRILRANPSSLSMVLLDRMMPDMDGLEVLRQIKSEPELKYIPVIMVTGAAEPDQIVEGIEQGAFYYLTKPYRKDMLLSLIKSAANDYSTYSELVSRLNNDKLCACNLNKAIFHFCNIEEAKSIIEFMAHAFPNPEEAGIGLWELAINAIEHGNLEISYQEKTELLDCDQWNYELERRLSLPENAEKKVILAFEKLIDAQDNSTYITVSIEDQGSGFNWEQYLQIDPERLLDSHGRGILMCSYSFDTIEYIGKGNKVIVTKRQNRVLN